MGVDGESEMGSALQPDRYCMLSDGGSFFFDPAGDNDGFESPEAAAEWARTHRRHASVRRQGDDVTRVERLPAMRNFARDLHLVAC